MAKGSHAARGWGDYSLNSVNVARVGRAVLGASIIIMEGVLSLSSSHQNWLVYRKTCEALKHEKYLFLAKAGVYQEAANLEALLAERVESILAADHETWLKFQAPKQTKDQL